MEPSLYISLSIICSFVIVAFVGYMAFLRYLRHKEYFGMNDRKFSAHRYGIEEQLVELNRQLLRHEDRFKEVNHLLIASQEKNPSSIGDKDQKPHSFLSAYGLDVSKIEVDPKMVFVLTPFHPSEDHVFFQVREICQNVGLTCIRGDERPIRGEVFYTIITHMLSARLIIANINGRNPNVYYELGIAHALNKEVILIAESPDDIPFDLRTKNILIYKHPPELERMLQLHLARHFAGVDR